MSHPEHPSGAHVPEERASVGLAGQLAVEPLVFNPNNSVTSTVERLTLVDGSTVVRKVLARDAPVTVAHWAAGAHPGHWNYWRREADAYRCGAVRAFEPFLEAPSLLGHAEPRSGVEVLYLRDVEGPSGAALRVEDLAASAYLLGRAQASRSGRDEAGSAGPGSAGTGASGAPRGFTSGSREWIWSYATSRPPGPGGYVDVAPGSASRWDHPVVIEGFGDERGLIRRRYGGLLSGLPRWRRLLARCPRAFCHLDLGPRNLIMAGTSGADRPRVSGAPSGSSVQPVPTLVDWSFAGSGAAGEDPGQLVAEAMLEHCFTPGTYDRLDREVWDAYSCGLTDSRWPHDLRWARLAMCIAVLRFVWMPAAMVASVEHRGPTGYAGREGLHLTEVFSRRGVVFRRMLERIDEAHSLTVELDLV